MLEKQHMLHLSMLKSKTSTKCSQIALNVVTQNIMNYYCITRFKPEKLCNLNFPLHNISIRHFKCDDGRCYSAVAPAISAHT